MPGTNLKIKLKSFDNSLLGKASDIIIKSIVNSGGSVIGPICIPTSIQRIKLLNWSCY
jgi:ribosomal protein S10